MMQDMCIRVFKFYASTLQTAGILILNDFYILCSIQIKLLNVTPLQTLNNKYASCITSVIIICICLFVFGATALSGPGPPH